MSTTRQIVICCDGTGNQFSTHPTNVIRLWRSLARDQDQVTYYDPGVGTLTDAHALTRVRKWFYRMLDGAIGSSVRDNALEAYSFLMARYEPGMQIYLFGFSRGAYTVRALAGMLSWFGVLRQEHANVVPYLWLLYSDEDGEIATRDTRKQIAAGIKADFSTPADVHFLGAWDTVSSFGWGWRLQSLPGTASAPGVHRIRHAVAVDERRSPFVQNLFLPREGHDCVQMLFPGAHSDVGGGYPPTEGGLAAQALRWMTEEAAKAGLRLDPARLAEQFDPSRGGAAPDENGPLHNEMRRLGWKLVEVTPRSRRGWALLLAALVAAGCPAAWPWGQMALLAIALLRLVTRWNGRARDFGAIKKFLRGSPAPRLEEHSSVRTRSSDAPKNLPKPGQ